MTVETSWLPQWTTPVKIESGGRYALGLNRFHNGMEDLLIKSIIWLAESLPYFTFACWAIGDIERTERPENYGEFVAAYQRRESALAIGRYMFRSTDYIPGSNIVSAVLNHDLNEYDTGFSVMKSEKLGAFGLYYAGSAYNLGLVEYNENGVMVLTNSGRKLHNILDRRYQKAEATYYKQYRGKSLVPKDVLMEWGSINQFETIRGPDGRPERDFYKNLLFRLDQPEAEDFRRASLTVLLECIAQCEESNTDFSEDILRTINYYKAYTDRSGGVRNFNVPKSFLDVQFYWNIYEGHVYFRDWLSRYFQVFLNHLKRHPYGSTVEEFFDGLNVEAFDTTLSRLLGHQQRWLDGKMAYILDSIDHPPRLEDSFSEENIAKSVNGKEPDSVIAAMFTLMMVDLWHHFRPLRTDPRYFYILTHLGNDLWFDTLFLFHNLGDMPVRAFLRKMLEIHIIAQHDKIMMEKHDLRRCWFMVENGRYFFVADESLIGRPAKFSTIMAYLRDMNLITGSEIGARLTAEGRELFFRLKREFFP